MWAGELNAPPDAHESDMPEPKRACTGDAAHTITLEPSTPIVSVNPSGGSYTMGGATGSGGTTAQRPQDRVPHTVSSNRYSPYQQQQTDQPQQI